MKIAIIGAGLSGLTLVHKLKDLAELSLFEKSRGFGGRMATRRYDSFQFDHGAQFFKAKSQSFRSFLKPLIEKGVVQIWKGSFVEFDRNKRVNQRVWGDKPPHYIGAPGMNAIGKYLAKTLEEDVTIHLNSRVKKISPYNLKIPLKTALKKSNSKKLKDIKWELQDDQNKSLGVFDWVITTAPAEQALALLPKSFKYYSKLSSIKMQACFSLMLGFKKALPLDFHSTLVKNKDISWISVNSSKPGRGESFCLLVHSTNDWADKHIEAPQEELIRHLCKQTSSTLGLDVSKADHKSLNRWRCANIEKQENPQLWIDQKLALCGDWTQEGKVEAAFLSAEKTARTLRQILQKNRL